MKTIETTTIPTAATAPHAGADRNGPAQIAAFLGMTLIWGSTFLVIRLGNEAMPPMWGAAVRLAIAAAILGAIAFAIRAPWPRGASRRAIAWYGFLNFGLNFVFIYWGELTVASGVAATVFATSPFLTGLLAGWRGLQPLDRTQLLAAGIGLVGVGLIFSGELAMGAPVLALSAILGAVLVSTYGSILLKEVPPHSSFVVNAMGCTIGLAVCLLASFLMGEERALPRTWAAWGPLLYLVLAGNLGAYVLYTWLLSQWKVTRVHAIALAIPVVAVVLGALVRGESPAPLTYPGALLVLAGTGITLLHERR
ncbi:MAG TPA: EamA family transporter [Candidatus Eisenbacteria bacterium]|nr:EamA family transporter [Candidatus Eisenbacteria bacterium]